MRRTDDVDVMLSSPFVYSRETSRSHRRRRHVVEVLNHAAKKYQSNSLLVPSTSCDSLGMTGATQISLDFQPRFQKRDTVSRAMNVDTYLSS